MDPQDTPDEPNCKAKCRKAFFAGRRAGLWLAFNGPKVQRANRFRNLAAMRQQDRNLEGLGDVFGQAEQEARQQRLRQKLANVKRPMVQEEEKDAYPDDGKYDDEPPSVFYSSSSSSSSSSTPSSLPPAPLVKKRPVLLSKPSAPPPEKVFLTPSNASQFIGKQVFFTAQGGPQTATIKSVAPSGINISGASPAVASSTKNSLTFSRRMWVMS
jgi:hypothetical protein